MKITDFGIIIDVYKHGEKGLITSIFTRSHGLIKGYSMFNKKNLSTTQVGAFVEFEWNARVDGQLGKLTLTNEKNYTLLNFSDYTKILAISSASSLLSDVLMEREELPQLYDDFMEFLENLKFPAEIYLKYYALFELSLLKHLGFGLDLTKCAVSGVDKDLSFISPKTGNAVSFEVGSPYENKLFKLPQFFTQESKSAEIAEILDGIDITRYFLGRNFFAESKKNIPQNAIMFSDELLAKYRYDQEKRDIHRDIRRWAV